MSTALKIQQYNGTGRRKSAVARVFLQKGSGQMSINGRSIEAYFQGLAIAQMKAKRPLTLLNMDNVFDIKVNVNGSGLQSQADAICLGIARALVLYDETGSTGAYIEAPLDENAEVPLTVRAKLGKYKLLTRDSRRVERKKVGFRKARKVEQYSKR